MAREIDTSKPLDQETVDYLKARVPMQNIQRLIDQVGLKKGVIFQVTGSATEGVVVLNGDDSVPPPPPEAAEDPQEAVEEPKKGEGGKAAPVVLNGSDDPEDLI